MNCPHCGAEIAQAIAQAIERKLSSEKIHKSDSDLDLPGVLSSPDQEITRSDRRRVRGKAKAYSPEFEIVWKSYGRRENKVKAYFAWNVMAEIEGGEQNLLKKIIASLDRWQRAHFDREGWNFAPHLERYLRNRRWEDEPPARGPAAAPRRPILPLAAEAERNLAAAVQDERERDFLRSLEPKPAPPEHPRLAWQRAQQAKGGKP